MKRITLHIVCFIFVTQLTFAANSYAQPYEQRKLSLKFSSASLKTILSAIEKKAGVVIMFEATDAIKKEKASISVNNLMLSKVLDQLLKPVGLEWAIRGNVIRLYKAKDARTPAAAPAPADKNMDQIVQSLPDPDPVKGRVTDSTGAPLVGATVHVRGTSISTKTDEQGNFTINAQKGQILEISFVGYNHKDVVIREQGVLAIVLSVMETSLDQLVVIGYGTQKERDLTGAVATVKGNDVARRNEVLLSTSLQGLAPGVAVTRASSIPGNHATIRVRGITTIGDSDPLILVDGVPVDNIDIVNPNDVENISVLKDAASASIYGARASAGVILITTKKAKNNELNLEYQGNYGITQLTEFPATVNYKRYMEMINEIAWNDGGNQAGAEYGVYSKDFIESYAENHRLDPDRYPITNWADIVLKKSAPYTRHGLNLSYGNKAVKSKISLNYEKADALTDNRSFSRITTRMNNDITINKYLSAEIGASFVHELRENANINPVAIAYKYGPLWTPYWSDGRVSEGRNGANTWARVKYGGFDNSWDDQVLGRMALHFKPVKNLTITGTLAPTIQVHKEKKFNKQVPYYELDNKTSPAGFIDGSLTTSLAEARNEVRTMTKQLIANYSLNIVNRHYLTFMAGYEDYYRFVERLGASSDNFLLTDFPYLDRAPLDYMLNTGNASEVAYRSYFGRITYDFDNKYLIQANLRYDGSSRFHPDYRWASFPSISLGWVISEENFFKNIKQNAIDFIKFRGSLGTLGNERIGSYPYQSILNFSNALFVQGGTVVARTTAAQQAYNIRDISWETTESWNIGLDARFLNDRLSLTVDYYRKNTKDMLLALEIPDYMGYSNPSQNAGLMHTKGWDAQLGWSDKVGDVRYSVSVNMSDYKSVMGNLSGIVYDGDQIIREGSEFNEWYGYVSDGLYQSAEDVANSPKLSVVVAPGDVKYKDISGPDGVPDGKISPEYDRVLLGGSLPRFLYGGNINVGYKGFDASLVFQGVGKQTSRITEDMVYQTVAWHTFPDFVDGNYYSEFNTKEQNSKAKYPRLSQLSYQGNNYKMSDFWLFDGSYFRLKNITLGYTLPANWIKAAGLSHVRLYTSATDLFSINKYPKGWDPEAGSSVAYVSKTWNFGIQVRF
jgi:TonB-linked outer membrane protein, SusC/RagA family